MIRSLKREKRLLACLVFGCAAIVTAAVFAQQPAKPKATGAKKSETEQKPGAADAPKTAVYPAMLKVEAEYDGSFFASPNYMRRFSHAPASLKLKRMPKAPQKEDYRRAVDLVKEERKYFEMMNKTKKETTLTPPALPNSFVGPPSPPAKPEKK